MIDRSAQEIREYLADLKDDMQALKKFGIQDFAGEFAIAAMESRTRILEEELKQAEFLESSYVAEALFTGLPIKGYAVQSKFLGHFLIHAQDLVNALAQVFIYGQSMPGRMPNSLVDDNILLFGQTVAGSFGARFSMPEIDNRSLFDQLPNDFPVLETLSSLLDGTNDAETLLDSLSHLRVTGCYAALMDHLASQGADLKFRTRFNPRGVVMTNQQAAKRSDWIESLQVETEVTTVFGELTGASLNSKRFEITSADGFPFMGKMSENVTKQLRALRLGDKVEATIEAVTSSHEETGAEKVSYRLLDVHSANVGSLFISAGTLQEAR